ncbi:MAG TPA: YceK/YidQ family lipoprotein [Arsenophonus sp.]
MIDISFSALLDTVLVPYDSYDYFQTDNSGSQHSVKERVQYWENDQVANTTHQNVTIK